MRLLREIERIADFVDRGFDPVAAEEFGRAMQPASSFLREPAERALALDLESRYQILTKPLQYSIFRKSCGRALIR
jgi:hypothetical protein